MLTPDVVVEDFTVKDWTLLTELFRRDRGQSEPSAGIVALTESGRLLKLLSTVRGRLDPAAQPWPSPLSQLAMAHGGAWALRLERGTLEQAADRWARRLDADDSLIAQALALLAVLRELEVEGVFEVWPKPLSGWPLLNDRIVLRGLDALCPVGKTLLFAAFENGALATSMAMRRGQDGFDRIVGPEQMRHEMGLLSGDWTRDYRHLARAVELGVGPLALGAFGETETFRRLANDSSPGAWAAAVAVRDILLHPIVPAAAIPIGIDLGRAAFATVQKLASRVGPARLFGEAALGSALGRLRDVFAGERQIEEVLGAELVAIVRDLFGDSKKDERKPDE